MRTGTNARANKPHNRGWHAGTTRSILQPVRGGRLLGYEARTIQGIYYVLRRLMAACFDVEQNFTL